MRGRRSSSLVLTAAAFLRMGFQTTASYPMSFALSQAGTAFSVLGIFFMSRIVRTSPIVADNYVGFVVTGIAGQALVANALQGVGLELDAAIQQGRLETLLIEPIRWPAIPAFLALWPITLSFVQAAATILIGVALGVHVNLLGLLPAVPLVILASLSGLALGVLAGSVRILAKRSDPVWLVYSLLSGLVGGVSVPINVLPPALRALSWCFPTTYVVSGLRKFLLPHAQSVYGLPGAWSLAVLAAIITPLAIVAAACFGKSIQLGRRLGVLAGY